MTQEVLNRADTQTKQTRQIIRLFDRSDDDMKDAFFRLADILANATKEVETVKALDLTQPEQIEELYSIVRNHEISDAWTAHIG